MLLFTYDTVCTDRRISELQIGKDVKGKVRGQILGSISEYFWWNSEKQQKT
jgi:hypothetical protein